MGRCKRVRHPRFAVEVRWKQLPGFVSDRNQTRANIYDHRHILTSAVCLQHETYFTIARKLSCFIGQSALTFSLLMEIQSHRPEVDFYADVTKKTRDLYFFNRPHLSKSFLHLNFKDTSYNIYQREQSKFVSEKKTQNNNGNNYINQHHYKLMTITTINKILR